MEAISYDECRVFRPVMEEAKCVRVYDGDTIHLGTLLPHPYGPTRFCCRLLGVDTPELRSTDRAEKTLAREAREIVKSIILHKVVRVRVSGHDKYGRLLVRISTDDCEDLSRHLIEEKVAVSYDGGARKRSGWDDLLRQHIQLKSSRTTQGETGESQMEDNRN